MFVRLEGGPQHGQVREVSKYEPPAVFVYEVKAEPISPSPFVLTRPLAVHCYVPFVVDEGPVTTYVYHPGHVVVFSDVNA